jgi:muconolactone D-isomerase
MTMLFHVTMTVRLPADMDPQAADALKAREKAIAADLQKSGKWRHLWRVAGAYANVSVFDVEGNADLHDILTGLPLFPFMEIGVTPLCRHPSSIRDGDL